MHSENPVAQVSGPVEAGLIVEVLLAIGAVLLAVVLEDSQARTVDLIELSDPGS